MDGPTHVLLAATTTAALFKPKHGGAAVGIAAVGALVPDLDGIFLSDQLDYIRIHRGATHSLFGAAVLSLGLAALSWPFARRMPFKRRYFFAIFGMLLAIATDVTTWWGTQVFWPFSDYRARFGLIFIIDLWLSGFVLIPWVAAILTSLRRRPFPQRLFRLSFAVVVVWFGVCLVGRTMAKSRLDEWAKEHGAQSVDVFPQPFSPLRWALVTRDGRRYRQGYVDLLYGDGILEPMEHTDEVGPATEVVDATEEGRLLRWFYRLPIHEVTRDGARTTVVFRDLAYAARTTPLLRFIFARFGADTPDRGGGRAPFRYRFVLDDGRVVTHGWRDD